MMAARATDLLLRDGLAIMLGGRPVNLTGAALRVLLVEDSERLTRSIRTALRARGLAVDPAANGNEASWLLANEKYDVVVLDIMLPGIDGLTLLAQRRAAGDQTHVLLLTARDSIEDRVRGLTGGADDYLVKPFAIEELIARVEALARRAHGHKAPTVKVGDLEIDTSAKLVFRAGRPVTLTPREYAILEYLARRAGEVVSRGEIEANVYDRNANPMSNVVDAAVYSLRKKLEATRGGDRVIETRHGFGYVLVSQTVSLS